MGVAAGTRTGSHSGSNAVIDGRPARARWPKRQASFLADGFAGSGQDLEAEEAAYEEEEDSVELILWYHTSDSAIRPIYSVDARHNANSAANTGSNGQLPEPQQRRAGEPDSLVPVTGRLMADNGHLAAANSTTGAVATSQLDYNNGQLRTQSDPQQQQQQHADWRAQSKLRLVANVLSTSARHYVMAKLSARVRLMIRDSSAYLIIHKVAVADAGEYKCRVDYKQARTRYQLSELAVISKYTTISISSCFKL